MVTMLGREECVCERFGEVEAEQCGGGNGRVDVRRRLSDYVLHVFRRIPGMVLMPRRGLETIFHLIVLAAVVAVLVDFQPSWRLLFHLGQINVRFPRLAAIVPQDFRHFQSASCFSKGDC